VYYLPLAYAPILGWMGAADGWSLFRRTGWSTVTALAAAVVLFYIPQEVANAGQPSRLATLTVASAYFFATALLWAVVMRSSPTVRAAS